MKNHLLSLGAGILIGILYALLGVHSPAPPVIALVGCWGCWPENGPPSPGGPRSAARPAD
jgi:XapX domain-containing protein